MPQSAGRKPFVYRCSCVRPLPRGLYGESCTKAVVFGASVAGTAAACAYWFMHNVSTTAGGAIYT